MVPRHMNILVVYGKCLKLPVMWDAISELKFREEDIHFSRRMGYIQDASDYIQTGN